MSASPIIALALGSAMAAASLTPRAIGAVETLPLVPLSEISRSAWAAGSEAKPWIRGDRLVLPRGAGGVSVFDISNPASPREIATVDIATLGDQAGPGVLLPDGRLLVVLPVRERIAVVDITGAVPVKLGEFGEVQYRLDLDITDGGIVAYDEAFAGTLGAIETFDPTPTIPVPVGTTPIDLTDSGFHAVPSGLAFLGITPACGGCAASLDVFDTTTGTDPALLGTWQSELLGNITAIDVVGTRVAIAAYWAGLWIVDASDVTSMRFFAGADFTLTPEYAIGVALLPPFVLLLQGGPDQGMNALDTLRLDEDGTLDWISSLPLEDRPDALIRAGHMIAVKTTRDTNGDGAPDETVLDLYETAPIVFADGFDT